MDETPHCSYRVRTYRFESTIENDGDIMYSICYANLWNERRNWLFIFGNQLLHFPKTQQRMIDEKRTWDHKSKKYYIIPISNHKVGGACIFVNQKYRCPNLTYRNKNPAQFQNSPKQLTSKASIMFAACEVLPDASKVVKQVVSLPNGRLLMKGLMSHLTTLQLHRVWIRRGRHHFKTGLTFENLPHVF